MKKNMLIIVLLFGIATFAQNQNYIIKTINANTEYSDFGVTYYGDSSAVFTSSRKVKKSKNRKWNVNGQPFLDLYKSTITKTGEFVNTQPFSEQINSKFHESNVAFTKDLKTVYFSRDNYINKLPSKSSDGWILIQLFKADIDKSGKWVNIQKLPFNNNEFDTGHPALNFNEDKLYFVSNRPGSLGLTDIWVVEIEPDGTYSEPINLGPKVNTSKREMFPYIDDKNVLYYSSDGFSKNYGGLDLYAVKIDTNYEISNPVNLGLPLNSSKDDFGLVFQNQKKTGHFSSNREGGKGDDDIYYFEELTSPIKTNCNQFINGVVRNNESGALLPNALVVLYDSSENEIERIITDKHAAFSLKVACNTNYKVAGSKEHYNSSEKIVTTSDQTNIEIPIILTLGSNKFVHKGDRQKVKINSIYFDLDQSVIRPDAEKELEKVVKIMKKYPQITISLESHTDSRATDNYNLKLSKRRVKSTIDWMIFKGIESGRISGKSYGETKILNKCFNGVICSEDEHQLNRRIEFVIEEQKNK
ncbi:OmpA family protein [Jejuia spongiicola]|uniref:OmpA family protein n=1 Tax=Jejuia spongiicola TaxID=2942207 RepID=A0ABT0QI81_9FLAO|nr:OmpA family protein [Jejuia spongiicola]MCL6296716.1 OmpA family protein [Jejuia spongiicola]